METIEFYAENESYGEFSNFARYPIKLKGRTWPTVEHYFQAQKHAGTPMEETIRTANTPMLAARLGRDRKVRLRRDWESVKETVMLEALRAKFSQHAELGDLLLSTGEARLVEHSGRDAYWGDGGDGSGRNRLGALLIQVRREIRDEAGRKSARYTPLQP